VLLAVLDVEEQQATLGTLPADRLHDLVVNTRAACLASRQERACQASQIVRNVYASRPEHDPALVAESAQAGASIGTAFSDVPTRARAVRQMADDAVRKEGSPEAALVERLFASCRRGLGQAYCSDFATFATSAQVNLADHPDLMPNVALRRDGHPSKVGSLAGLAVWLVNDNGADSSVLERIGQDLPQAEGLAKQALEEANKVAAARAERERKLEEEKQSVAAAVTECASNESACKTRCSTEPAFCMAWADRLQHTKPPKFTDAKTYFQKACDGGVQFGCTLAAEQEQWLQQAEATVNSLWSDVTQVGDDLVQKMFVVENVTKIAKTPRLRRDVQTMLKINATIAAGRYCPAKRAFIQGASAAEFQKRAATYCKDQTPTGLTPAGTEVKLTAECRAVYEQACP
jgi:hypothetical protein